VVSFVAKERGSGALQVPWIDAQPGTWFCRVDLSGMGAAVAAIAVVEDLTNLDFNQLVYIREIVECRSLFVGGDECNFVRGSE